MKISQKIITNHYTLLTFAAIYCFSSLYASIKLSEWQWFARSGAILVIVGVMLSIRRIIRLGYADWLNSHDTIDYGRIEETPEEKEENKQSLLDYKCFYIGSIISILGTLIWAYGDIFDR